MKRFYAMLTAVFLMGSATAEDAGPFHYEFEELASGDTYIKGYYDDWFEQPLRKAAIKELSGKPMKEIEPSKRGQS